MAAEKTSNNNKQGINGPRPTLSLPTRATDEYMFLGATEFSPGLSSFFSETDPNSFSQLQVQRPCEIFTIPAGLSPSTLLDSPTIFNYQQPVTESAFGMAPTSSQYHQLMNSFNMDNSSVVVSHFSSGMTTNLAEYSQDDNCSVVDKPADDGYNWRKYGQKKVKRSRYPRSYYKCTKCPVKKKVERSVDGQFTDIIYIGEHNHNPPPVSKRSKEAGAVSIDEGFKGELSNVEGSSMLRNEHGSSDSEDVGNEEGGDDQVDEDELCPKRRLTDARASDGAASHRTLTGPKIVVQTTSEVALLDDGYKWRKYGQKEVKGNPNPRSYYQCTTEGCKVRKHVERAATDQRAVITSYAGKHNHDVPVAKNSSQNTARQQELPNGSGRNNHGSNNRTDYQNNSRQRSGTFHRLEEEQLS